MCVLTKFFPGKKTRFQVCSEGHAGDFPNVPVGQHVVVFAYSLFSHNMLFRFSLLCLKDIT